MFEKILLTAYITFLTWLAISAVGKMATAPYDWWLPVLVILTLGLPAGIGYVAGRKSLAKLPSQYSAPRYMPPCPTCGARKWAVDKYRIRTELPTQVKCWCAGYPILSAKGIPHRKGSKYCEHHPHGVYNQAKREGVYDDNIAFEHIGRKCRDDEPCPF